MVQREKIPTLSFAGFYKNPQDWYFLRRYSSDIFSRRRVLLFLIESRIEAEKFVISSYRWSVPMLQETYDNRDNLERLQYLVWDAGGKVQWED